jgi:hypothetical protein
MTKSTLNALLAGGGLVATWFAVTPASTPRASHLADAPRSGATREVTVDDLNVQEARLREHLGSVPLRPTGRNPFRFGKSRAPATPAQASAAPTIAPAPVAAAPQQPALSLSGIFTDKGKRSAIITGDAQLYVVKEGESVAGRYRVVIVDSDAVTLKDDAGTEIRLVLH